MGPSLHEQTIAPEYTRLTGYGRPWGVKIGEWKSWKWTDCRMTFFEQLSCLLFVWYCIIYHLNWNVCVLLDSMFIFIQLIKAPVFHFICSDSSNTLADVRMLRTFWKKSLRTKIHYLKTSLLINLNGGPSTMFSFHNLNLSGKGFSEQQALAVIWKPGDKSLYSCSNLPYDFVKSHSPGNM